MNIARLWPVLVAAASTMVVGFLWYSPLLFARPWMIAMGYDPDDKQAAEAMKKSAGPLYGAAYLSTLITAFVLLMLRDAAGVAGWLGGLQLGFWCWAGFVAPVKFTDAIFGKRGRTLLLIDSGYQLVCLLAMGAIVGGWPR
jgi:hypothetical protein